MTSPGQIIELPSLRTSLFAKCGNLSVVHSQAAKSGQIASDVVHLQHPYLRQAGLQIDRDCSALKKGSQ